LTLSNAEWYMNSKLLVLQCEKPENRKKGW